MIVENWAAVSVTTAIVGDPPGCRSALPPGGPSANSPNAYRALGWLTDVLRTVRRMDEHDHPAPPASRPNVTQPALTPPAVRRPRGRRRHPAARARRIATGLAVASTVGLVGVLGVQARVDGTATTASTGSESAAAATSSSSSSDAAPAAIVERTTSTTEPTTTTAPTTTSDTRSSSSLVTGAAGSTSAASTSSAS